MLGRGASADEPHHIEAHRLGIHEVHPVVVGFIWKLQPDGEMVDRVGGLQEEALAIQPEIAFLKPEISESATRGGYIRAALAVHLDTRPVQEGVVEIPQVRRIHAQPDFYFVVTRS